jgi:hypothetical protein
LLDLHKQKTSATSRQLNSHQSTHVVLQQVIHAHLGELQRLGKLFFGTFDFIIWGERFFQQGLLDSL